MDQMSKITACALATLFALGAAGTALADDQNDIAHCQAHIALAQFELNNDAYDRDCDGVEFTISGQGGGKPGGGGLEAQTCKSLNSKLDGADAKLEVGAEKVDGAEKKLVDYVNKLLDLVSEGKIDIEGGESEFDDVIMEGEDARDCVIGLP